MATGTKRKLATEDTAIPNSRRLKTTSSPAVSTARDVATVPIPSTPAAMSAQLLRIASSDRTPFEKKVWALLCQIPAGHFSTYGAMAAHLGSSPRAIGNAMRRNPFAPEVPCHRCVAAGGKLGGFKGQWPKDGEGITLDEKRLLLKREGVRFDGTGRVLGTPFAAFV
jgi:methylated-DNA-[protein]-cysteine S-methyltransferase